MKAVTVEEKFKFSPGGGGGEASSLMFMEQVVVLCQTGPTRT